MSSIDETIDGIVIVEDVVEVLTVLRSEHGVLHELVGSSMAHEVAPVRRHHVDIEMLPLLSLEVCLRHIGHPLAECLEVASVRSLGIRIARLESLRPSLVKSLSSGEERKGVTVVEHLPTLHP